MYTFTSDKEHMHAQKVISGFDRWLLPPAANRFASGMHCPLIAAVTMHWQVLRKWLLGGVAPKDSLTAGYATPFLISAQIYSVDGRSTVMLLLTAGGSRCSCTEFHFTVPTEARASPPPSPATTLGLSGSA